MRCRGVASRSRRLNAEPGVVGELLVFELRDAELRRTLRVACLRAGSAADLTDLLPPLMDASLLWMSTAGFALGGFERLVQGRGGPAVDYAQTWWCRPDDG
jgi:hypothetical protein